MAVRLTNLRINELSGVDDPANEAPGWIVAKSREFKNELEDIEKAVVGTHELLDSNEMELYLADAPDLVEKAREILRDHLADGLEVTYDGDEDGGIVSKLRGIFQKDSQPVLGEPGATRQRVKRVTPAEAHDTDDGPEVTEDQGEDELTNRQDISGVGTPSYPDDYEPFDPPQEPLGEPAATRSRVGRVTPAESHPGGPEVTEDQGADELGAPGPVGTSHSTGEGTSHTNDDDGTSHTSGDAEEVAKSVAAVLEQQLDPLRDAIGAIADRQEALEKASALPGSIDGQDGGYSVPQVGLTDAIGLAARGKKVNLTG